MVVKEALRRMQDFLSADSEVGPKSFHEISEIARVRLVGPDVFRRVNRIEGYGELLVAGSESLAIDVREDDQLVVLLKISERLGRVGEGRPIRNGSAETVVLFCMDLCAPNLGEPRMYDCQEIGVAQ